MGHATSKKQKSTHNRNDVIFTHQIVPQNGYCHRKPDSTGDDLGDCTLESRTKDGSRACQNSQDCVFICNKGLSYFAENHVPGPNTPFQQMLTDEGERLCRTERMTNADCYNIYLGAVDVTTRSSAKGLYVCKQRAN
jgi:hypothetical protein